MNKATKMQAALPAKAPSAAQIRASLTPLAHALGTALLLAGLSACSLAPDLPAVAAPLPAQYDAGPANAAGTHVAASSAAETNTANSSAVLADWQQFFQPEKLQQLQQLALGNNKDLRLALLNVDRVRAQYQITDASRFPALDLSASQSRQRLPADLTQSGSAQIQQQASVNVGVTAYELDLFGKVRNQSEQALQQLFASEAQQQAAQVSLLAEVATRWFSYAGNLQLRMLAEHTARSRAQTEQMTARQAELGAVSQLTLQQARSLTASAEADVARYQRLLSRDLNALQLLLAQPVPADLLPLSSDTLALPELAAGVPSALLTQRPDLQAAEHRLKAANANIGVARAAFFPSISLTASAGTASGQLSGLFEAGSGSWSFVPQLNLPIFNMGRTSANLQLAETDRTIALETYQQSIVQAFREVADSLADLQGYRSELQAVEKLEQSSFHSKQLSQARYQQGVDSYLQLLDSERSWYNARQQQLNARLAYLQAQVGLYKALGGGWRQDGSAQHAHADSANASADSVTAE